MNERASSGSVWNFFLILIASGLLAFMLNRMGLPIVDFATQQINPEDNVSGQGLMYTELVIEYWPIAALFTAIFLLLATAIVQRRVGV